MNGPGVRVVTAPYGDYTRRARLLSDLLAEAGVPTADEFAELRAEVDRLRAELADPPPARKAAAKRPAKKTAVADE